MTSEQITRRSDILNTQVITRNNGKRLGIVNQVWVDIDQREVVALSLRDSLISVSVIPQYMYLEKINQIGDVILVDDEEVIEDINVSCYSTLINWEVITENGEVLGKVRSFKFNGKTGKIDSIVVAYFGLPQIPDQLLSTYELSIEEIVSTGPNRLIVFEGAEERVTQLTVGLLERLGLGKAPWEGEDEGIYTPRTVAPSNQLPSGVPLESPKVKIRHPEPVVRQEWDEDYYEEQRPHPQVMKALQYETEPIPYEEEDNWSSAKGKAKQYSQPFMTNANEFAEEYNQHNDDLESDAWEDKPQPVNIPPKEIRERQPEYEEEI
ncbi:hypothetical protein RINTHH_8860 [Richelia intracellularis HH01]|uniref:PRC-barrel domain-containing protein n=1 Tax=Richelia intracellularis HH01 TaxID=1165094 RepID=M1X528_9NOST|nr:PRC-barrel domain-containing protein [Richelia intracellularis]CCH67041.1 hypothetical protein RINTHH_8860 [Richelia intracellularis HH01]HAE05525.1 PRC-barrel domain containing protein [Richelia sp.]